MFTKEVIAKESHLSYIDSLKERSDRLYFLVKKEGSSIGVIDFTSIDYKRKQANIGLYSNPNIRGVGSDLMYIIIEYGFKKLKFSRLISEVFEENIRAISLYEKFGFNRINKKENLIVMELIDGNR
jgi:UDP-4-amino-4,6-dideoxy-N-acetyl-beta-L-altrosamine N-acetyltransferase